MTLVRKCIVLGISPLFLLSHSYAASGELFSTSMSGSTLTITPQVQYS